MRLWNTFPIFPVEASTMAPRVDALYLTLVAITAFFGLLITALVIYFAVRYRRRSPDQTGDPVHGDLGLEVTWTAIPLAIVMVVLVWSSYLFVAMAKGPDEAIDVYVVAKQWMWTAQHLNGSREINALHVPVGRAVRLTMTSQDVIHDFFVPVFRMKADVIPGRYTRVWFEATQEGHFHLFCAEYCGTNHSAMRGDIVVMSPADYEDWLHESLGERSLSEVGRQLFHDLACDGCHREEMQAQDRGPTLTGLFNSEVRLADGRRVVADDEYLRESILRPERHVVSGYRTLMPSFQGLLSEEQIRALLEYIHSTSRRRIEKTEPQ